MLARPWREFAAVRYLRSPRRRARSAPDFVHQFWGGFDASITFLKSGLQTWSY